MLIPGPHYPITLPADPRQRFELWVEKPSGELCHLSSFANTSAVGTAWAQHVEDGDIGRDDRIGLWHAEAQEWIGPALDDTYPPEVEAERAHVRATGVYDYEGEDD